MDLLEISHGLIPTTSCTQPQRRGTVRDERERERNKNRVRERERSEKREIDARARERECV